MKPLDVEALKNGLRKLHADLTKDLVARADQPRVARALRATFESAAKERRTGDDFTLWRRHFAAQVASAWLLSTLFVRVLEDRGLLPRRRLAGEGDAGREAHESREDTLGELAPSVGARGFLLLVFQELTTFEAVAPLFDPEHNLAWRLTPSESAARGLLAFWEAKDEDDPERLRFAFDCPRAPDTRFLGDVYEELDPDAKKRFALLQTPDFVERFILDRTLTPALGTFGLGKPDDPIRLIDPTCGSGHFLLGAFHRLVREWERAAPGAGAREWVTRALRSISGVDLNPYAVAIARFRIVLAAFEEAGVTSLVGAPKFMPNVTTADALLGGLDTPESRRDIQTEFGGGTWTGRALFEFEDPIEVQRLLGRKYHAVVGNPPYITPKDAVLNAKYRELYSTCHMKYALVVPFTQRFFELCVPGGIVGAIVANSFMKREFGSKLIEEFLPTIDMTAVYDTSGAYIPGHGTPTAILIGRRQARTRPTVRVAMGKRGEPSRPADPARGCVWSTIAGEHADEVGYENAFLSVTEVPGSTLARHPWSLGGGGAAELKQRIESTEATTLGALSTCIGFGAILGEDDAFSTPHSAPRNRQIQPQLLRPLIEGDVVRDWSAPPQTSVIFPYDENIRLVQEVVLRHWLWPLRECLGSRLDFSKLSYKQCGRSYWEYHQIPAERNKVPLSITFAFVSTHNHFVLDRGGKVFKQSAPVIKLPVHATEDDHLMLLGLLNSSTLGFWMKNTFFAKGNGGIGGGIGDEGWEPRFEYDGTKLKSAPIVDAKDLLPFTRLLDSLGREVSNALLADLPSFALASHAVLNVELAARLIRRRAKLALMQGLQEELDWCVYELYGLLPNGASGTRSPEQTPSLTLGHRPFEIALARRSAAGELKTAWFERHGSAPTIEVPADLPKAERDVIQARLKLIETVPEIALVEQPEYKRRWSADDLDTRAKAELRDLLLDRIEAELERAEAPGSVRLLAHTLERDPQVRTLGQVYANQIDVQLEDLVAELLEAESVAAFAACRYTETGLEKHALWEKTWELQRREDAGERVAIAVPPKYQSKDFVGHAWGHRGKLDVPKERFISYPGCAGINDPSDVFGWAGWDHLQRARALTALYDRRKTEDGWDKERLTPLLTGVHELIPWLLQWHNEPSEEFGGERPGESFRGWLEAERAALGLSVADLAAWRPKKGARAGTFKVAVKKAPAPKESDAEGDSVEQDGEPLVAVRVPVAAKRATRRRATEALDADRLLAVLAKLEDKQATLAALVEALASPQKAVRLAADVLVEAGKLRQTKQRPITYQATEVGTGGNLERVDGA